MIVADRHMGRFFLMAIDEERDSDGWFKIQVAGNMCVYINHRRENNTLFFRFHRWILIIEVRRIINLILFFLLISPVLF